ncbi:MAG: hypothetical protein AB7T32_03065 [Dehalococcoidia bacterium]
MPRRAAVSLIAICAIVVIAAAAYLLMRDDGDGETALQASTMTVEELYAEVDRRLEATDGGVVHITMESSFRGLYSAESTGETWIVGGAGLVREEVEVLVNGEAYRSSVLTVGDTRYTVDGSGSRAGASKFLQCHGASVAASLLLSCPQPGSETSQRVEEGTHRGTDVVVLIEQGEKLSGEQRISFMSHLYLDARTLMPIELRSEGLYIGGTPLPFVSTTEYGKATIVSNPSLGSGFFEPSGIGYVAPDPLAAVRAVTDLQAYWLGRELTLPDGRVIVLLSSYESPGRGSPYRLQLQYATREAPYEPPFLTLMVFHRDMWERSPAIAAQAITFGDVVVFVNSTAFPGQQGLLDAPGSLEFVFSQLRPFGP